MTASDDGPSIDSLEYESVRPNRLDDYRLICKLGEGTFSEVLKVRHVTNGKVFAMKRFRKHFQSYEDIDNLREIQALRRLNPHQNIIDLQEIIFDPKQGILSLNFDVMDCNLFEFISKKQITMTEAKAKAYMYQICKGLEHIHSKGIFHRDIKPENILIKDSVLKIADFGSCRGIYSNPPFTEYIATRWYRSPECLLCDGMYSLKMDIWACGCVCYEIIAKVPLFPGTNELDQIHKIHTVLGTPSQKVLRSMLGLKSSLMKYQFPQKDGVGVRNLLPHVSKDCVELITAMLTYHPDDRITARDSVRHRYFQNVQLPTLASSTADSVPARTPTATKEVNHSAQGHQSVSQEQHNASKLPQIVDSKAKSTLKPTKPKNQSTDTTLPTPSRPQQHNSEQSRGPIPGHQLQPLQHPSQQAVARPQNQTRIQSASSSSSSKQENPGSSSSSSFKILFSSAVTTKAESGTASLNSNMATSAPQIRKGKNLVVARRLHKVSSASYNMGLFIYGGGRDVANGTSLSQSSRSLQSHLPPVNSSLIPGRVGGSTKQHECPPTLFPSLRDKAASKKHLSLIFAAKSTANAIIDKDSSP